MYRIHKDEVAGFDKGKKQCGIYIATVYRRVTYLVGLLCQYFHSYDVDVISTNAPTSRTLARVRL